LVCLRKETKKVNNKFQDCAIFRHEEFASELHVFVRWVKVDQEGQPFEAADPRIHHQFHECCPLSFVVQLGMTSNE
jgi:hypothetical protein